MKHNTGLKTCSFCVENLAHPNWLYLTTDRRFDPMNKSNPQPTPPYVGRTKHPHIQLKCLNRARGFKTASKASKAGSPYHRYECIIGPFYGGRSKLAKERVQNNARKPMTRMLEMKKIAMELNLSFFLRDVTMFKHIN